MEPYRAHRPRMSAPPICPDQKGIYREATEEELEAAYNEVFPNGPEPLATFRVGSEEDMARAKAALSPEALSKFFGPGGGGMTAFEAALRGEGDDEGR